MNRRIPNGSWCLWSAHPSGTRQGKVVLAQLREHFDPDTGGHYTVEVYSSSKKSVDDGERAHQSITLSPDSTEPYQPIELSVDSSIRIIAELIHVFGP